MRPPLATVLLAAAAIVLASCGDGDPARPAADAGAAPSPSASSAPATPAPAHTDAGPLLVAISIHVEGFREAGTDPDVFARHRDLLLPLAQEAADHGAVLSFEFGRQFVQGATRFEDPVITDLLALGHGIGVHADVGGQPTPLSRFVEDLTSQKAALEQVVGRDVPTVSGVCSSDPWVEAVDQAGFLAVSGLVEFCLTSLPEEQVPAEHAGVLDCTNPSECHGVAPTDPDRMIHPWTAASSEDWLTPAADGVLLIAGRSGTSLPCMAEPATVPQCTQASDDIDAFVTHLDEFLAQRDPARIAALNVSWSIGSPPEPGFAVGLFEAVAPYVSSGDVAWASIEQILEASFAGTADGLATAPTQIALPGGYPQDALATSVVNPANGANLAVDVLAPSGDHTGLAVVLVPGGSSPAQPYLAPGAEAEALAAQGITAVAFDPDGRGRSGGEEDNGGHVQQDGMAAVVSLAAELPNVDRVAVLSRSFGVTIAAGAIARHDLDVVALIDWEGPMDRTHTGGCDEDDAGHLQEVADCDDESFWSQREAVTFLADLGVPYVRIQRARDHAQPDLDHTIKAVNAALRGAPVVDLNGRVVTAPIEDVPRDWLLDGTEGVDVTELAVDALRRLGVLSPEP